jgi:3-hydroxybutyrate dehydrogenase/3-oxoacyl-[acyl-carrier protein] reductase
MDAIRQRRAGNAPVALVTGASSGTGRDIAFALAEAGYDVGLVARRTQALSEAAERIVGMGRQALALTADVTDARAVATAIANFVAWSGDRADVLVNAAGITGPLGNPIGDFTVEEFDAVMATNLRAPFLTMSHILPVMRRQGFGRVVNIGGNHGMRGRAGRSSYSASKWGLRGLTRSAALEVGSNGITVNYIAPGPITVARMRARWAAQAEAEGVADKVVVDRYIADMGIATGRANEPQDIVSMVMFLVGPGGRNITGQEMVIDGGVIV